MDYRVLRSAQPRSMWLAIVVFLSDFNETQNALEYVLHYSLYEVTHCIHISSKRRRRDQRWDQLTNKLFP